MVDVTGARVRAAAIAAGISSVLHHDCAACADPVAAARWVAGVLLADGGDAWLRERIVAVAARVQTVLDGAGVPGWTIQDGVLCASDPARGGELVAFDSLSTGTQDLRALELVLSQQSAGDVATVLLLSQESGQGMDPDRKLRLSILAREREVSHA